MKKEKDTMSVLHLDCECFSEYHSLRWHTDAEWNEIWCDVHIRDHRNIFRRIINAFRYVFRFETKYGHFDSFILRKTDIPKLVKFFKEAVKESNTKPSANK